MKLKLRRGRNAILATESVILLIVLIAVGVAYFYGLSQVQPSIANTVTTTVTTMPKPPSQVTLSGTVSTTGIGASPTAINFVSATTGISYPAQISGSTYTLSLPNTDTYNVKIDWKTFIDSGTCGAGTIPLFIGYGEATSITANWSC